MTKIDYSELKDNDIVKIKTIRNTYITCKVIDKNWQFIQVTTKTSKSGILQYNEIKEIERIK